MPPNVEDRGQSPLVIGGKYSKNYKNKNDNIDTHMK